MRTLCRLLGVVALAVWAVPARAASTITIRGDLNDTVFAQGKEHSIWTGNVVLTSEDTTIYADRIDLWGKDFVYADCEGNLRVLNREKEILLTADRISYNRETKYLVALGNVYMEDRRNGLVVKGDSLQYDDERDETIIQIRVRIFGDEEELQCRAEFARYLRGEELLVLSGTPYVLWKGDEYRAVQITITLDDGDVKTVKMVEGTGKITKEDEPAPAPAPAAPEAPGVEGGPAPDQSEPAVGPGPAAGVPTDAGVQP
jgi:lipopolysaccharide export system protein LptA